MKIKVDPEVCVGTGSCISISPELFELNDEGVATVKAAEVPSELASACREAAESCPVEAISVEE